MGDMYRVAVVDDHPIARWGITAALAGAGDLKVVADAPGIDPLGDLATYDVVTLDLYLGHDLPPGSDPERGAPCLDLIAAVAASVPVLVVSASQVVDDVLGAVRAGSMGYVTKSAPTEFLVSAVRTVAGGGFAFSPDLAGLVRRAFVPDAGKPVAAPGIDQLSPREVEALRLIGRGLTHDQVGTRMGIRKSTVDTYVERIRSKLAVGNKADLARLALTALGDDDR